jgi:Holliday junction DNA helicase RuvA
MIAALRGKIFQKENGKILLDVNGVIYELHVSMFTFSSVSEEDVFYITERISENEYTLYAFTDKNEKKLFDSLIKLNGVGPKVALAVCSTYTPQTFMDILANQDVNALKKVPGIGPKSAKRILMEMGEFDIEIQNPVLNQAANALESLGFNKADVLKALSGLDGTLEEVIKTALKRLSG